MYTWHLAQPEEVNGVCELFRTSGLWNGQVGEIQRRIMTPLLLKHLITFYNEKSELCGFVTFAFLSEDAEKHMPTVGILTQDWKSGDNFWAVDFVVKSGENGYKMMRGITRNVGAKKVRFFREKNNTMKEFAR